ncbi:zinc-ribbon domain-containing protein [Streptomyces sp. NPDC001817]|uniref:zinc-ribbon domain-containing protein n=1 Tax=Streptomyces sp. NPDC001817 TaxID=3154398 RepID=UPI00332395A4
MEQWDGCRNGALTPWMVSVGSSRKVHWRCHKGEDHRWKARIHKRAVGQGCRFCAGHEASETTSLLFLRPDLAARLDAEKSGVSAVELTLASNKEVHWFCPIHPEEHTWPAKVLNRTLNGTGCPDCNLPGTSAQEVRLAAELGPYDLFLPGAVPVSWTLSELLSGSRSSARAAASASMGSDLPWCGRRCGSGP